MWNCRGVVQGVLRLHIRCAVLNICWRTLPVRKICTFLKLHTHNLWHRLSVWPPHDIVWHFFLRLDKSHPEPQNTSYIYFNRVSSSPHGHDEYIDLYVWKWWSSSLKSPSCSQKHCWGHDICVLSFTALPKSVTNMFHSFVFLVTRRPSSGAAHLWPKHNSLEIASADKNTNSCTSILFVVLHNRHTWLPAWLWQVVWVTVRPVCVSGPWGLS